MNTDTIDLQERLLAAVKGESLTAIMNALAPLLGLLYTCTLKYAEPEAREPLRQTMLNNLKVLAQDISFVAPKYLH